MNRLSLKKYCERKNEIVLHRERINSTPEYSDSDIETKTDSEINRTWQIASYQNNNPNPFIVDESLIYRAYFFNTQLGDANLDSIVNVVDVVLLVSYIFGESNLSEEQFLNADIDNNSIINVSDIIALIDIILS